MQYVSVPPGTTLTYYRYHSFVLGGLGSCVAKVDVLANDEDDLMFLAGKQFFILYFMPV